jgi:hypothetical protein
MRLLFILLLSSASALQASLLWPTPNPAFQQGKPIETYIQPTISGNPSSGLFGCVRNGGSRFHEGIDLYPIKRDSRGEALDPIFSVLPGKVVHVSRISGYSSYGRYVVVEHDGEVPAYHTLYSHLASVAEGIAPGVRVEQGTVLGVMGRSATYTIPRSRAHLHFEIGFRLSDDFQTWFDRQNFSSVNRHGIWNGMNLVSIDPKRFYEAIRAGEVSNLRDHLRRLPPAARIRVHTRKVPDFVKNYPALLTRPYSGKTVIAWDIAFTRYGLPREWTPRFNGEGLSGRPGDVKVIAYNPSLIKPQTCKRVLDIRNGKPSISSETITTIKKLFGFK